LARLLTEEQVTVMFLTIAGLKIVTKRILYKKTASNLRQESAISKSAFNLNSQWSNEQRL